MEVLPRSLGGDKRLHGARMALWTVVGACLIGAPAFASQVGVLQREPVVQQDAEGPVLRWEPSVTLLVGSTLTVLGEEVFLSVDPGATLQSGPIVPGGTQAPFHLESELAIFQRAEPALGPVPSVIRRPADPPVSQGKAPRLGPGAEFILQTGGGPSSAWAFLRVLQVTSSSARFELVECSGAASELQRDPLGLLADAGAALSWTTAVAPGDAGSEAPRYLVERRAVGDEQWRPLRDQVAPDEDSVYRFVDTSARAEPPAVFEYRVSLAGSEGLGAFVRAHGFSEGSVTTAPGSRVNLISGEVAEPGQLAHMELGRSLPGSIMLEPSDGVRFHGIVSAEQRDRQSWRLPDPWDPAWLPGKALRISDGEAVAFLLPGGVMGRLAVEELGSERWVLRRTLSYDDSGILPSRPGKPLKILVEPAATTAGPNDDPVRLFLSVAGPPVESGIDPRAVGFVLEHQPLVGMGDWEVLGMTRPGATTVEVSDAFTGDAGARRPLARLRLRYQISFGPRSAPSAAFDVLSAGANSALRFEDLDRALAGLAAEDFQGRYAAGAFISAMGEDARPALEALAGTAPGSPEGIAALDFLRALDESGGASTRLQSQLRQLALSFLRDRGAEASEVDQWLGKMPNGLAAQTARARAHALLMAVDRASRGGAEVRSVPRGTVAEDCERALSWAHAMASLDPDEGVRWMARFVGEIGLRPSLASFEPEGPVWLLAPERRASLERLDFGWGDQPSSAEELRWQLEARPELASLRYGPALARLHAALAPAAHLTRIYGVETRSDSRVSDSLGFGEPRLFDYDSAAAELVLQLVERSRAPDADPVLLKAAESLLPGARLTLEAWRSVSDRRLATPSGDVVPRKRIELEGGSLSVLSAALSELTGETGVDIVLSAGRWSDDAEAQDGAARGSGLASTSLVVRSHDVRIMPKGDGAVRLHAGLRVYGRNVVLQDLIVDQAHGQALTVLDGGHVVALGCDLRGVGTVIHLQRGTAEIIETKLGGSDPANLPATAVRLILASRLYARASLFDAGTIFVSSGAEAWLDRCVLDARSRMLVQAQDRGHLYVRESLLRGVGSGLFRVSSGLLVGSVIDVPRDPLGRHPQSLQDGGIRVSPRFFHLVHEGQEVPPAMQLDVEPLAEPFIGLSGTGQSPR